MNTERWEYRIVGEPGIRADGLWQTWVEMINEHGRDGWEVMGWHGVNEPVLLKRRLPEDD